MPSLQFFDDVFEKKLYDIMAFHKMLLIAYPAGRTYFISIDLDRPLNNGRFRKRTDFNYFSNFSNRFIRAAQDSSSLISTISRQISYNENLYRPGDGDLIVGFIFPQKNCRLSGMEKPYCL